MHSGKQAYRRTVFVLAAAEMHNAAQVEGLIIVGLRELLLKQLALLQAVDPGTTTVLKMGLHIHRASYNNGGHQAGDEKEQHHHDDGVEVCTQS